MATTDWQRRLLPLMSGLLLILVGYFLVLSHLQLQEFTQDMRSKPPGDVAAVLEAIGNDDPGLRIAAELEHSVLLRRYRQADNLLIARTWRIYLGFLTGMILAFIGAAFILGKLREEASSLDAQGAAIKMRLSTASPGIMLSGFGVVLMVTTLLAHQEIQIEDRPTYVAPFLAGAPPDPVVPDPTAFPGQAPSTESLDALLQEFRHGLGDDSESAEATDSKEQR